MRAFIKPLPGYWMSGFRPPGVALITMQKSQIKFTYRDYLLLPELDRRELIEGDFFMVPAPNIKHQTVVFNLGMILGLFVRKHGLGKLLLAPTDVVLSDEDVVQPDLLFVSNARRDIITEDNVAGAPDLVIEVLSPSTAERDMNLKLTLYARVGVGEYWIVDPDVESVQVIELSTGGQRSKRTFLSGKVSSRALPGVDVEVGSIFTEA